MTGGFQKPITMENLLERWICRACAHTVFEKPVTGGFPVKYEPCPDCEAVDWHHTKAPIPEV